MILAVYEYSTHADASRSFSTESHTRLSHFKKRGRTIEYISCSKSRIVQIWSSLQGEGEGEGEGEGASESTKKNLSPLMQRREMTSSTDHSLNLSQNSTKEQYTCDKKPMSSQSAAGQNGMADSNNPKRCINKLHTFWKGRIAELAFKLCLWWSWEYKASECFGGRVKLRSTFRDEKTYMCARANTHTDTRERSALNASNLSNESSFQMPDQQTSLCCTSHLAHWLLLIINIPPPALQIQIR